MKNKKTAENFLNLLLIKNWNFTYVQLKEKSSALQEEHPALQEMRFIDFFLCLWIIFALLNLDLDCESGYGSREPIESGSTALLGG
jgi:hypothetical protein